MREVRAQLATRSDCGDSDSAPQCFALPGAPSPAPAGLPVRVVLGASRGMAQCPAAPEQRPVTPEDIRRWWESTPALVRADLDVVEGFWTAPLEVPRLSRSSVRVGWTVSEVQ